MGELFGTDGVRGIANTELDCETAFRLGQAAVEFLGHTIVVGKDTRVSGDMLESALAAGVMSKGGTVLLAGIIPTPAVALLTRELIADGGIVISASHNSPEYNGIKFFDNKGFKSSDSLELKIEEFILSGGTSPDKLPSGAGVGVSLTIDNAPEIYIQYVVDSIKSQGFDLSGLRVALDVGHGAAALTSSEVLRRLGAQVVEINEDFNGSDINVDCGSTHLEPLKDLMAAQGADVGIAHDGDADRVMMVDPRGSEIDGDMIEAVLAVDLKERGLLAYDTAVSTIMCNLGFIHAMRDAGIDVVQTQVGDRYVLEEMLRSGFVIGGEQSGHIILLDHNTTGDGLLVACHFLAALKRNGKSLEELVGIMTRFPQALINVRDVDKKTILQNEAVKAAIAEVEGILGDSGRVLVRPSGTEPLVRVMVEAEQEKEAHEYAEMLASVMRGESA